MRTHRLNVPAFVSSGLSDRWGWARPSGHQAVALFFVVAARLHACPTPHFQAVAQLGGLTDARALATSDLNQDGQPDLIVERLNGTVMTLSILGYGPDGRTDLTTVGSFRLPTEFGPMRFGNLNADSAPDLVMMSPAIRRFSIYFNQGNGLFANPVNIFLPSIVNPEFADIARLDFDSDGDQDILVVLTNAQSVIEIGTPGALLIYSNNGSGVFTGPVSSAEYYFVGRRPLAFLGADNTSAQAPLDLMFLNRISTGNSTFIVRRQGGNAQNMNLNPFQIGFSNDVIDGLLGNIDLANFADAVSITPTTVYVRRTIANGTFEISNTQLAYFPGITLNKVRSTDFNNDGRPDLVLNSDTSFDAVSGTIGVYINQGNGQVFGAGNAAFTQISSRGLNPLAPVFADMDQDGDQDMAVLNTGSSALSIFYNSCIPSCDVNGDLNKNVEDLYSFYQDVLPLGLSHPLADYNRDGEVDAADSAAVVACLRASELQGLAER